MHYKENLEHHCQVGSPEETIGDTPRADIKNEVAKQFVLKKRTAKLADKTIVNYFQVVRAVVASAVSSEMIGMLFVPLPCRTAIRLRVLGIHELGERHVESGDSPVGFLSSYGVSMEGCRLEARRASFFSCARRNRSSTDVVLSGEGFPNRFRYRCSIYALRGIFHSSCS